MFGKDLKALTLVRGAVTAAAVLVVAAAADSTALAAAGPWSSNEQGRVRLVSASETVGTRDDVRLGLQFQLDPGWKIYWRSPGDAGFPPTLDWSGSENLDQAALRWPVPHRFSLFGLETFGYADEVVLPIHALAIDRAAPLRARARIHYLTCSEICVPVTADVSLDLPPGEGGLGTQAQIIDRFDSQVPGDGAAHGLQFLDAGLVPGAAGEAFAVRVRSTEPLAAPDVIVEGPEGVVFGIPEVQIAAAGREAVLTVPVEFQAGADPVLDGRDLVVTLFDGTRGLEKQVVASPMANVPAGAGTDSGSTGLLTVLALAVLGGLILNLMPCVLPVLSLKLLSVVGHGGGDRRAVRFGFLASAAGIVASFGLLAAGAIALKSAGLAAGWGIQFQQPLFLVAMMVVLTVFAANLMGWFHVPLPRWAGGLDAAARDVEGRHGSLVGHFLTGALATLLATPCSAPFVGTAVGFALSRGWVEIALIFAALGLGLAIPYLLVAAVPSLATRLPRPGRWMVGLRRLLGLALAGTAVWLLWVFASQAGIADALKVALGLVAVAAVLWRRPRPGIAVGTVAGVALALLVTAYESTAPAVEAPVRDADWAVLDPSAIAAEVAAGRTVFVDVTADWCITCKVNKSLVLENDPVAGRLAQPGVVAMRGDWTLPDRAIADYLASFGRYGIPFNAVYGPGAPDGIALPELLSDGAVLEAFESASGS